MDLTSLNPQLLIDFDKAFFDSLHPDLKAAYDIKDEQTRINKLRELADQGHVIDFKIFVVKMHPHWVMFDYWINGYRWYDAINTHHIWLAPGFTWPGVPSYDPFNQPKGTVTVIDITDKSKWPKPWGVPPAPEVQEKMVGRVIDPVNGIYACNVAGWKVPSGGMITEDGISYFKVIAKGMIGETQLWYRIRP